MHVTHERWIWLRRLAVVALYSASYTALRHVSFPYWFLPAGMRLLCLLFVPYRYWPSLLIGEMLSLAKISYDCYEILGLSFALLKILPPIALAMPIVWWCRTRLSLLGPRQEVRMNVLILCTFLLSMATAARDYIFLYVTPVPAGQEPVTLEWAQRFFIGNYLGILTIVPLALMAWQSVHGKPWKSLWASLSSSRLAMDSVALLLPSLLLLSWIVLHAKGELAQAARMAMFLPVTGLALRRGWYGAAIGGSAASLAMVFTASSFGDAETMQAEAFISFAITAMLMLGARIATLHTLEKKERIEGRLALQAAQEGLYLGELRMQHAADRIEDIGHSIRFAHDRLLRHVHQLLPHSEESGIQKQVVATQHEIFHLADGMHPRALARSGLSHVLQQGTLALAFGRELVPYRCEIRGNTLADVSPGVQLALYRLACEAAIYLYEQATLSQVAVRVRIGATGDRHWAVLQMDGSHARNREGPMPSRAECQQFRERLSANGRGMEDIRNRTRIYGGAARSRPTAEGTRLSLLLHDVERTSAPH